MARFHTTSKGNIPFSIEEEAAADLRDAEQATPQNKANLKLEELATKSSEVEEAGIVVNGLEVATDRNTQALLNGAFAHAGRNPTQTFSFKGKNGWANVNKDTIDAVNNAVGNHVRATFDNEKLHNDSIQAIVGSGVNTDAEKLVLLEAYDITTGWAV